MLHLQEALEFYGQVFSSDGLEGALGGESHFEERGIELRDEQHSLQVTVPILDVGGTGWRRGYVGVV